MAKHFLYLTNVFLSAYLVDRSGTRASGKFSTAEGSSRELERYLVKHRKLPVHLVLDLTEEDYRAETIPHVRGADQAAVLNRRLGQVYRNTPYRHAIVQGREPDGRRDDKVLYHGIPNADLVKPWLTLIERLEIPLEGIYSAPVLSGQLLHSLDVFFPHTLLVSLSSGHGLRQTYFQNKHIKFSRLTQLQSAGDAGFGSQVAEECSRTWQYLDSLRFLTGEDQLEVCILVSGERRDEVARAIKDYPLLQFRLLETQEVARALKLKNSEGSEFADELLVSLFARARIKNHFAQSDQTRSARLRKLGVGLHVLSGALIAGSAVGALGMLIKAQQLSFDSTRSQFQAAALAQQYKQLMGQMQTAQVSADTSKDAAAFSASYLEPATSPVALLSQVSTVVARHPNVTIFHIGWRSGSDEGVAAPSSPAAGRNPLPVRTEVTTSTAESRDSASVGSVVANIANQIQGNSLDVIVPGTDFQVVHIDATIGPFTGDYRDLLSRINAFVEDLGTLPGCSASLISAPLDTRPGASMRGTLSDSSGSAASVPFRVRVLKASKPKESARGK